MLPPPVIAVLKAQLGVATRAELLALGFSRDRVDGWVRHGLLERVAVAGAPLVATYRRPGGARPPEQGLLAAVKCCGASAALTGGPLLAALRVEGFDLDAAPVVRVPLGRRWASRSRSSPTR